MEVVGAALDVLGGRGSLALKEGQVEGRDNLESRDTQGEAEMEREDVGGAKEGEATEEEGEVRAKEGEATEEGEVKEKEGEVTAAEENPSRAIILRGSLQKAGRDVVRDPCTSRQSCESGQESP